MISLDKLMNLSEAATGFKGGSVIDELPGLSLTEAAAGLPIVIMESQIEMFKTVAEHNEIMVEAVVTGLQTGTQADVASLSEAAFSGIKEKIESFFARLKKWINSLIAKLKIHIDKTRMTGKQMIDRYSSNTAWKNNMDGLVVNGYRFGTGVTFKNDATADEMLASVGLEKPEEFQRIMETMYAKIAAKEGEHAGDYDYGTKKDENGKEQQYMTKFTAMKDSTSAARKLAFAKKMVSGVELRSEDSWQEDIKKALYGSEKVDLKYGTDFDKSKVEADLVGQDLDELKRGYESMKKQIEDKHAQLKKSADELDSAIIKGKYSAEGKGSPKIVGMASEYYSMYMNIFGDCTNTMGAVKNIHLGWLKEKTDQAKKLYAKMLTYNKKKDTNDASDIEDIDVLDYEL